VTIYYLGGSPCSGKSTVAELLARERGFVHYKLDDKLDEFMRLAARDGKPACQAYFQLPPGQEWMRKPEEMFADEVRIYEEIFAYAARELARLEAPVVIAEGAGFLPELMRQAGIGPDAYVCIVPTPAFQVEKYRQRPWIAEVLAPCADRQAAFANWMERDALFARHAAETAERLKYRAFWTDGRRSPGELLQEIAGIFGLEEMGSGHST
jgi:dephospho-CoA kinase